MTVLTLQTHTMGLYLSGNQLISGSTKLRELHIESVGNLKLVGLHVIKRANFKCVGNIHENITYETGCVKN